jgi:hypothetical protein
MPEWAPNGRMGGTASPMIMLSKPSRHQQKPHPFAHVPRTVARPQSGAPIESPAQPVTYQGLFSTTAFYQEYEQECKGTCHQHQCGEDCSDASFTQERRASQNNNKH